MIGIKKLSAKARAQLKNLSNALLRRKSKAATAQTGNTASSYAHSPPMQSTAVNLSNSSPNHVKDVKAQHNQDGHLLSNNSSNHEHGDVEADRPHHRELPSIGSLSGMVINSSSQFDMQDFSETTAMSETSPHHSGSPSTQFDTEDSANTSNVSCETVVHHELENHALQQPATKPRIPMVERSDVCFSPLCSVSSGPPSTGNEDTAEVNHDDDNPHYGVLPPFDFSTAMVSEDYPEDHGDNDAEPEPELSEEFVKSWRSRHGYN
ncbi:uncharacterized protein IWZ02DRAFT_518406 [Phyllosticta citriasiana]|uniref:uncharacterized protein n=1 Tax=Phyllosticta citriasiana TaxID=595635 RepID=UPI0030FDC7D5